ncbi:uncharacterized protein LOC135198288 [Macrobrachium nipponense]|uniref:uncharacterized protein LOC135198288 n=1 Tax=Macrobrachium nipponense TaxID=159736 RepID=UPI0030C7BD32
MRCNGVNDCPAEGDDSDETHCDNVHDPPESYNKDRPPLTNTPLVISVKMVRVHEVSVEEGLVQIWLRTITKWQDSRLKFTHLSDIARDNIIRNPDRIWLPKYSLPNALFKDDENYRNNLNLRSTVFIHRLGSGEFDIHNGYEVYEYNGGKDVELEKDDDFLVSYLCDFELDYFPFDCHVCYIEIVIVNHGSFTSHFDMAVSFLLLKKVILTSD